MGREKEVILLIVVLSTCFSVYGQDMLTDPDEGNLSPLFVISFFFFIRCPISILSSTSLDYRWIEPRLVTLPTTEFFRTQNLNPKQVI